MWTILLHALGHISKLLVNVRNIAWFCLKNVKISIYYPRMFKILRNYYNKGENIIEGSKGVILYFLHKNFLEEEVFVNCFHETALVLH